MPSRFVRVARHARSSSSAPVLEPLEGRMLLAAGDFGFLRQFGTPPTKKAANNDLGNAVFVDRVGNTYLAGGFIGTTDFNPSPRKTFSLTSAGQTDVFVAKFAPDGSFLWARQAGGATEDQATGVVVDRKGNVFVGGGFTGDADFRPGKRFAVLHSQGTIDAFVWKLDKDGNFGNAVQAGGAGSDAINGMALDGNGNVAISGFFAHAAFFGNKTLITNGGQDAFVAKLTPKLGLTFVKQFGGAGEEVGNGVAFDAAGNLYQAGGFSSTVDFDPGAGTVNVASNGGIDAYVVKLDAAGNYSSVRRFGGADQDVASAVAIDRYDNAVLTGTFSGTADFDPGAGTFNLVSAGQNEIFVAKVTGTGALLWARRAGGVAADAARGIKLDKAGNVYTSGQFNGTADFDPGAGTFNLAGTPGVANGYVWKLSAAGDLVYAKMLKTATGFCDARAIALGLSGEVYTAGFFSGTVDFNPGAATANGTTGKTTSYDAFLLKLLA